MAVKETFGEAAPKDPSRLLNSAPVIDRLVRQFFATLLRKVGDDDFMDVLEFEAARLNGLFLGSGPDQGLERGPWNTPEQLGAFVLRELTIDGEDRNGVRDAFMVAASQLLDLASVSPHHADPKWQAGLEKLVARLRNALLGVSAEAL